MRFLLHSRFVLLLVFAALVGAGAHAQTTYCSTLGFAIPDGDPAGTTDVLNIGDAGTLIDVDVSVNATHTWVGDLIFTLTSPDGTTVTLMDQPGVPASTFGCSGDNVDATFNDTGADGPVEDMCSDLPAIFGEPVPQGGLSAFNDEELGGDWTLFVSDNAAADTGTIDEWCVIATFSGVASEGPAEGIPGNYLVSEAYPNPFAGRTSLDLTVAQAQNVTVEVYNVLGQRVATLFEGAMQANVLRTFVFDASALPGGAYLVRMNGETFSDTRRITVAR